MLHWPAARERGWARSTPDGEEREREQRARTLLTAIATTMRALALSREEIARLPDNYAEAARASKLPDLFGSSGNADWIEIRWLTHRSHDVAANYRCAARVFVQPTARPDDVGTFLEQLRGHDGEGGAAPRSVALLTQLLLVASDGTVVPSPITYEAQFRGAAAHASGADIPQYELSRQRLLSSSTPGGLVGMAADMPAYLPTAGNDLSFATATRLHGDTVVAPLATRCTICHGAGSDIGRFATLAFHAKPGQQVTRLVSAENGHANDVAAKKMERDDFKSLRQQWR